METIEQSRAWGQTGRGVRGAMLSVVIPAALTGALAERLMQPPPEPQPPSVAAPAPAAPVAAHALPNFADIVGTHSAAVVGIDVRGEAESDNPEETETSHQRHTQDSPKEPGGFTDKPRLGSGVMGAGFIVSADGLIMTNAHLLVTGGEARVTLADRREFKAKVIGADALTDTAVLKIDAENLPTVRLGNPSGSRVGDWVLAIGAPFGFDHSVTAGIISAKARSLPNGGYVPFIQTDVALNPGNSGGPLFNAAGEVIGINAQIFSQTGGYEGISFAVPIDMALKVERELLQHGSIPHARLGMDVQNLDQSLALAFGRPTPEGVLVNALRGESPAAKAGLRPGDIILGVDGQPVKDLADIGVSSFDFRPGAKVTLSIWRGRRPQTVTVHMDAKGLREMGETGFSVERSRFGLALRQPAPQGGEARNGLVVEKVAGPAASAGILPGDLVLAVNGQVLTEPRQLFDLEARIEGHAAVLVQRGNVRRFLPLDLE